MGFFGGSGGGTTNAGDITSGTLALARGGSGADLSATGGAGQYVKQTGAGSALTVGVMAAGDLPSAIDAAKIADGSVSNAEFQYLNGVTSAIQTQINAAGGLSNASDITNGIQVEGADSADNLAITVDASGNVTLAPSGASVTIEDVAISSSGGYAILDGSAQTYTQVRGSTGVELNVAGTYKFYVAGTYAEAYIPLLRHKTDSITADSNQDLANATQLTTEINIVTTVGTAGDAVKLPGMISGAPGARMCTVVNDHATNSIQIFPQSGHDLGAGASTAVSLAAGSTAIFYSRSSTAWVQVQ